MPLFAAYLRKSRADLEMEARGEGETLARHRATLAALAARSGHAIGAWYSEVVSGESISARPEMQRLLSDVGAGKWRGVYVVEVERLARGDTSDQGRVARTFMFSKTLIITPAKTYDPTNEFDEEYFEFSLFMSRREYKTINRRIQAGRMQSIREGKYICSRPAYGYKKIKIPNDKGYTLEIVPHEAEVVRQVFAWYLNGDHGQRMGITRIANRLLDMHVDPGEQGGGWKPCRIQRMLTNEVYIGKIRWGHNYISKELLETEIVKKRKLSDAYQLYEGLHAPIIDEDTFFAAQKKLPTQATKLNRTRALSNPLASIVTCVGCGHTMRGKPAAGRQPEMLFCATHGCKVVRTSRGEVEAAIVTALESWLTQAQEVEQDIKPPDATAGILDNALQKLGEERNTLLLQKGNLYDLLERGIYSPDIFVARSADIDSRLRAVENAISETREQIELSRPPGELLARITPKVKHVLDSYKTAGTAQEKNDLLRSVVAKVEYFKEKRGNQHVDAHQFQLKIFPLYD